jgi:hypothetical protein
MANTPLQNAPRNKIVTQDKKTGTIGPDIPVVWRSWFDYLVQAVNAFIASGGGGGSVTIPAGPTSGRPTSGLSVGQPYFDTTLGYLIILKSIGPPNEWVNAGSGYGPV